MFNNVCFNPKTKIFFGDNWWDNIGEIISSYSNNVLLVTSSDDFAKPLLSRVRDLCLKANLDVYTTPNVKANPRLSDINYSIKIINRYNIGFVLAIGGGSTMDAVKFISAAYNNQDYKNHYPYQNIDYDVLPHGAITTAPATGSEVSNVSMVVNDVDYESDIKKMYANDKLRFDFVCIDPNLGLTLPKKQVYSGAVDIVSHCLEAYFTDTKNAYLMKNVIEGIIKSVITATKNVVKDGLDVNALSNLWLSSMLPMGGYPYIITTNSDWVVHNMEKPITSYYNDTHGRILGIMTIAWFKYSYKSNIDEYYKLFDSCFSLNCKEDKEKAILEGIENFESWIKSMNLPTRLSEINVDKNLLDELAEMAIGDMGYVGAISKYNKEQILEIYNLAY
ncbi:MAG: iron-containing alcohol dehydrogenase [Erysipelotrichaceae bacterium]